MTVNIGLMPHQGNRRALTLPVKFTPAEMATEEGTNPGTYDAMVDKIIEIVAAFQGVNTVTQGTLAGWSLGFNTPTSSARPSGQTSEQGVELTYEVTFPNSVVEKHSATIPMPILTGVMPFPQGQESRAYPDWIAANWSATAQALIADIDDWMSLYGYDGATDVVLIYADLVGKNY